MRKKSLTGMRIYLINSDESMNYDLPYNSTVRERFIGQPRTIKGIINTSKYQMKTLAILSKLANY